MDPMGRPGQGTSVGIIVILTTVVVLAGVFTIWQLVLGDGSFGSNPQGNAQGSLEDFRHQVNRPCREAGIDTPYRVTARFATEIQSVYMDTYRGQPVLAADLDGGDSVRRSLDHCDHITICSSGSGPSCTGGGSLEPRNANNHAVELIIHRKSDRGIALEPVS